MFIRPYTYLCLVLIMVLLNGKPMQRVHPTAYNAVKTTGVRYPRRPEFMMADQPAAVDGNSGSCCKQDVCKEEKTKNVEITLNASGKVYVVERNGEKIIMAPAAGGNSGSCNTQIVASDDAIVITGVGACADNGKQEIEPTSTTADGESTATVTEPSTDDVTNVSDDRVTVVSDSSSCCTQSVTPSDITTVDGQDGVSSEAPDTTSTESGDDQTSTTEPVEPPKENVTADCNINVIIIVFPGIFGFYPYGQMQPAYRVSPLFVPSPMYQLPYEHDMLFRAAAYDAPLAARVCEALNTTQSQNANQTSRVSVLLNGGYCYQFALMKNPTSTGLPYNIMDVAPISCPHGVFP
ncbi:uncharacterized protein DEA37_0011292 [Paragonimus westermani]|uniref:Uncharacterized protein n=1 Tax=Paragonimus westermani TaxID=34504 RepID=A0A5J4P1E0_9TREM|nr:uncharacterized protein DEA37_0011292 [Paragonimus westermani]